MDQLTEFVNNHWVLSGAWLGLFTLLIVSFLKTSSKVVGTQTVTTLVNREDAVVIDIRAIADFNKGHILSSVNIPFGKLKDSAKDLEKYQDRPIILVDANGMQSASAAQLLKKMGISQLYRLQGGLLSWTNDNLPLTK
jgi:rhodanese-related sulfurtransferase